MLYTNYDRYNTIQYNKKILSIENRPKGKGKSDDDKRVIYSCLRFITTYFPCIPRSIGLLRGIWRTPHGSEEPVDT